MTGSLVGLMARSTLEREDRGLSNARRVNRAPRASTSRPGLRDFPRRPPPSRPLPSRPLPSRLQCVRRTRARHSLAPACGAAWPVASRVSASHAVVSRTNRPPASLRLGSSHVGSRTEVLPYLGLRRDSREPTGRQSAEIRWGVLWVAESLCLPMLGAAIRRCDRMKSGPEGLHGSPACPSVGEPERTRKARPLDRESRRGRSRRLGRGGAWRRARGAPREAPEGRSWRGQIGEEMGRSY